MPTNANPEEVGNQRQLDSEIRALISTLTSHLTNLNRSATGSDSIRQLDVIGDDDDDGGGVRVVTLAGNNKGATMHVADLSGEAATGAHGVLYGDDGRLSALANSNYQAVNNSILLGGSCTAEDPGVHLDISEYVEEHGAGEEIPEKREKEKREKGMSKREQHLEERGGEQQGM